MLRNVYLVDLGTGTDRNLLPLSISLIASYCNSVPEIRDRYNIRLRFLRLLSKEATVASLEEPAVLGLACYQWNFNASIALAHAVKQRFPNCLVVGGAYSIPSSPARIALFVQQHPYVDILVHGEGELTFADLLLTLAENRELSTVEGISFRSPDVAAGFICNPERKQRIDLNDIPSPFLNGTFDDLMAQYRNHVTGVVWETTRGCPYSCTFCAWGKTRTGKVRQVQIERCYEELEWMSRNRIFYIAGGDSNFGMFNERDFKLVTKIADLCRTTGFPRYLQWNWMKKGHEKLIQMAEVLHKAGVDNKTMLSVQTFNSQTETAIKRKNISFEHFVELKKQYADLGLPTFTELILGLPEEALESFIQGLEKAMTHSLNDYFAVHLCSAIENSEMATAASRARYKIETRTCPIGLARRKFEPDIDIETEELVVGTSTMPIQEWQKAYIFNYMVGVLYNLRLAFFVINFLHHEIGVPRTEIIEFLISEVSSNPESYPKLNEGLRHLKTQQDMILSNQSSVSSIPELGGVSFGPHEILIYHFLSDPGPFYREIQSITQKFCVTKSYNISDDLLAEVILYQKARMPVCPIPGKVKHTFTHNVPEYFHTLVSTGEPAAIREAYTEMEVIIPDTLPKSKLGFILNRVSGSIVLHPYKVRYTITPKLVKTPLEI